MDNEGCLALVLVVLFFGSNIITGCSCYNAGERHQRTEAVQQGYGEWTPNDQGDTKFQWKQKQ